LFKRQKEKYTIVDLGILEFSADNHSDASHLNTHFCMHHYEHSIKQ